MTDTRRRAWLLPALVTAAIIAVGLAILGLVSPSFVLFAGVLAGCGLMHLMGHGTHDPRGGGTSAAPR